MSRWSKTSQQSLARVSSTDVDEIMPPPEHGKALLEKDIAMLRECVNQGEPWDEHWSFATPKKPVTPTLRDALWCKQSLDSFVLVKLEQEG